MAKKDLSKMSYDQASDQSVGTAKTFGITKGEEKIIKDDGIPAPRGAKKSERRIIYFFDRDLELLRKYQKELKKEHGKVTLSEIVRWAINTVNVRHFHKGF